jgi:hypothetical protein
MSAKTLAVCRFEPAPERAAAGPGAAAGVAAAIRFREQLWHEYRREAVSAGFSSTHAMEYATALSPELGRVVGAAESAPTAGGWFYQGRSRVTNRTVTSGLITFLRWGNSKGTWRAEAAAAVLLARRFRWWSAGEKN